jgi:hypothetical protein
VFTADEVADTVVGILDKLGVKEACVVGHSYGAHALLQEWSCLSHTRDCCIFCRLC